MLKKIAPTLFITCLALLVACSSNQNQQSQQQQLDTSAFSFAENNGGITLPSGFQAVVVADSVGSARHITVDDDGDIYVALDETHNGNGIAALRDEDGDGVADRTEYFGNLTGTGIALHNGYLYFASDTSVVRYSMEGVDLVPTSEPEMIVSELPTQNSHAAKPITFDGNGNLYLNVGAPANACQEQTRTPGSPGQEPCPLLEWHGGVWRFDANAMNQTQQGDGYRYSTGHRNAVALEWNSMADNLYLVQHGRDQLSQLWPDYYNNEQSAELPAEEFFKVDDGDDFGWPYTYYDQIKDQRVVSPEYGGDGETAAEEGQYEDPIMAFPGHWAPNDLIFYSGNQFPSEYNGGAFIAFHGSWNRAPLPQEGYRVTFVPFDGDMPAGDSYETFANGFKGADTLQSPNNADSRPMGLAEGSDGTLYITDSQKGKIWRVVHTGEM
ncbi:PQQ-dependent sugar dehydrogenase [Aliifodinibius sp. S!AR15-10]|uniref:PQQ-dependent sugar dehydrogenase n=1 Tax=Aliifodinibius sp. S!AR15-10 TaxID=2950437 RepID=UPI0028547E71|nr:PQQ-dependent sugar dehydrogenase [Aliifodinibius sp. S!AR15-10]MDR8390965.1 PQQ-dependent sugar dehydrogenase [Aliifodinibius sp. S!AR15-10]